ncbi:SH3 domain-containing protein [Candidatus Clostridium stratigraminis]|uniref:SH3 domain-containing protein n=1 Tax=Candidatus Clostridium stratigraminis TaxID=3381661 RepID=A0ABW8T5E5_9CLOT
MLKWTHKTSIALLFLTAVTIPSYKTGAVTATSISRSQAEQRALNMINLTWTYDKSKNNSIGSTYSSMVTQPDQLNGIAADEARGIPYNWGGHDSLDSSSYGASWTNFLDAVNKGANTGNVNTTAGYGLIPGTSGIDCSGFVQSVFNIAGDKLSTYSLFDNYFTKISLSQLKHMDILDRPGDHVLIFDRWGTLNGISGAYTYEATWDQVFGGIQGTKRYFVTMDDINNGYIPGRYINIVDDSITTSSSLGKIVNVNYAANFRTSPSTSGSLAGTIPKDAIVKILNFSNGWYQITYNGQTGFIYGNLINSNLTGRYVAINNAYLLNIRASASASSSIYGTLAQNQFAEFLNASQDGNWINIKLNGIQGYVYSDYVKYVN